MEIKINNSIGMNLEKLIEGKLLIQANSGGGKSWLIRRILEQSHGKVQQIVLDPEGEFGTLREKYDYILAGKDGDTPAESRSATLLARKLLELGVSAIIDLYELHPQERKHFVKLFLESLINAPKELWHPVMVVIDEAHTFAPEHGDSEALNAVIGLASLGRKRGFGAILATQRISKLHKDAASDCNNKLIGRASLDIDRKRAGEEIGFTKKEEFLSMRNLNPGEFYAFGPAISNEVIKITVGETQTTHPKYGSKTLVKSAPPTDAIKKVLGKLADLPKEAEKEATTVKELLAKTTDLKRQIRTLEQKKDVQPIRIEKIEVPMIGKRALAKFEAAEKRVRKMLSLARELNHEHDEVFKTITAAIEGLSVEIKKVQHPMYESERMIIKSPDKQMVDVLNNGTSVHYANIEVKPLRAGAMKMLNWLAASHPNKLSKNRLATLAGFSAGGGTFNTYISELKRNGWMVGEGDIFTITEEGLKNATPAAMPNSTELLQLWKSKFRQGAANILQFIYENSSQRQLTKSMIAQELHFEATGGTFNTYLSELRRNSLISVRGEVVEISEEFFE